MKLITKPIAKALIAAYKHGAETGESGKDILAKYFTPWGGATWYISEGMPIDRHGVPLDHDLISQADDWHLYGFCDLGDSTNAELGYVMLSDLESIAGPAGLKVERDLYFSGDMQDVLVQYGRAA